MSLSTIAIDLMADGIKYREMIALSLMSAYLPLDVAMVAAQYAIVPPSVLRVLTSPKLALSGQQSIDGEKWAFNIIPDIEIIRLIIRLPFPGVEAYLYRAPEFLYDNLANGNLDEIIMNTIENKYRKFATKKPLERTHHLLKVSDLLANDIWLSIFDMAKLGISAPSPSAEERIKN